MVTVKKPLVCKPMLTQHFSTEMASLWQSTRVTGAVVQADGLYRSVGVISFYGISGANWVDHKWQDNEQKLLALLCHLAHFRHMPLLLCMDANVHMDKSFVIQAMCRNGWTDLAANLGDTFKQDPKTATTNGKID